MTALAGEASRQGPGSPDAGHGERLNLSWLRLPFVSWERTRDVLRSAFWLVPAMCVIGAIGLGIGLIALDKEVGAGQTIFLFPGPPAGARSFLSSIIQAMISFTGLVFSITMVVLQLSSGQFSPRVLRTFLRDRIIQFALGVFIATFVYAMVVLRAVQGSAAQPEFVPKIAVTTAFGFVLLSVVLFIGYIAHVANLIRVATIIHLIGEETRTLIEQRFPPDQAPGGPAGPLPPAARTVPAPRAGVIVSVNEQALTELAVAHGYIVALVPRIGDFVPAGAPLFAVHPVGSPGRAAVDPPDDELAGAVAFDIERTSEQDVAFGLRQLVDIAERALSPGVNDPTTAVQALDEIHDLLRRLATRQLPDGCFRDDAGRLRVVVPQYAFADYLDFAVAEVWRYGQDSAQIPDRLADLLADLSIAALPEHRPSIARWTDVIARHTRPGSPGEQRS